MTIFGELIIPTMKVSEVKMPSHSIDWYGMNDRGESDNTLASYCDCFHGFTEGDSEYSGPGADVRFKVNFPEWTFELIIGNTVTWYGAFDYVDDWWQGAYDEEDPEERFVHFYKHDVLRNTERVLTYNRNQMTLTYEELPGGSVDYAGIEAAKVARLDEMSKWIQHYIDTDFKCKCEHCNNTWRDSKVILRKLAKQRGITAEDVVKLIEDTAAAEGKHTSDVYIGMIGSIVTRQEKA